MIDTTMLGQLAGKHVKGTDGENIGKIADVYESTDGGGGTFATVNTGLFGGGASFFPLDAAEMRGDDVVVPYSKSFIKDAPRVEADGALSEQEEDALYAHYGMDAGSARTAGTGDAAGGQGLFDQDEHAGVDGDRLAGLQVGREPLDAQQAGGGRDLHQRDGAAGQFLLGLGVVAAIGPDPGEIARGDEGADRAAQPRGPHAARVRLTDLQRRRRVRPHPGALRPRLARARGRAARGWGGVRRRRAAAG